MQDNLVDFNNNNNIMYIQKKNSWILPFERKSRGLRLDLIANLLETEMEGRKPKESSHRQRGEQKYRRKEHGMLTFYIHNGHSVIISGCNS